jgi:glycosyltransferase involved in cell wall biosynthesis
MGCVHILYLIPGLDGSGGAEQAVAALAEPYRRRGVRLDVVTFTGRNGLTAEVEAGGATVLALAPGRLSKVTLEVRGLVRSRRPDLVHTTLFDADLAGRIGGRLGGAPVVSSLVNVAYGPEQRANPALKAWKLELARTADRGTARLARRFHALSPHVAAVMGSRLGISADHIDVVPRGRDRSVIGRASPERRASARRSLGVDEGTPLVMAAARHEFQKGLDVLIRAWPSIRADEADARLLIGGRTGSQTSLLEQLVADQGPDAGIELIGARDDVPDLLCAADAFVVPSRWEGLGSILVEAMALEAPVVASSVGPVPELAGSWARLVPPDDPAALAAAVLATLHQPPAERERRARVAVGRFDEGFTLDAVADAMVAFYGRALG